MKLEKLKNENRIYSFSSNYSELNHKINSFKKDIKIIKDAIKTDNKDILSNLSKYTLCTYSIAVDNDLLTALKISKSCLRQAFNQRFFKQRISKFLTLTGNDLLDDMAISQIEKCRELLYRNQASLEDVFKILPSNHKFNL